jgi:hypothetical protein
MCSAISLRISCDVSDPAIHVSLISCGSASWRSPCSLGVMAETARNITESRVADFQTHHESDVPPAQRKAGAN